MDELLKNKYNIMLETSGSLPLNKVPKKLLRLLTLSAQQVNET